MVNRSRTMLESTRPTSSVITISLDVIMPSVKSLPAIVYAPILLANQAAMTGKAADGRDFRKGRSFRYAESISKKPISMSQNTIIAEMIIVGIMLRSGVHEDNIALFSAALNLFAFMLCSIIAIFLGGNKKRPKARDIAVRRSPTPTTIPR